MSAHDNWLAGYQIPSKRRTRNEQWRRKSTLIRANERRGQDGLQADVN